MTRIEFEQIIHRLLFSVCSIELRLNKYDQVCYNLQVGIDVDFKIRFDDLDSMCYFEVDDNEGVITDWSNLMKTVNEHRNKNLIHTYCNWVELLFEEGLVTDEDTKNFYGFK